MRFAFQSDYFPAVWTTNVCVWGGLEDTEDYRLNYQLEDHQQLSWKRLRGVKGCGGRVQMETPEGHGPWTNWLQTVQGVVGGRRDEARKSPE